MSGDIRVTISSGGETVETTVAELERLPSPMRDQSDLAATVERARTLLDEGDYQAALILSSGAYDKAKAAASYATRIKAGEQLIGKARRMQADALLIESRAKIALAYQVDEAQAAGMIAVQGRPKKEGIEHQFRMDEIGLKKKEVFEARRLRDAEEINPGFLAAAVEERISAGLEPSRRWVSARAQGVHSKPDRPSIEKLRLPSGENIGALSWYEVDVLIREYRRTIDVLERIRNHCVPADSRQRVVDVIGARALASFASEAVRNDN